MGIGGSPIAKNAQATPSQSPWETQSWFMDVVVGTWIGEGTSDRGGTPRLWKGGEGPPVPGPWQNMAAFGPWIEGPGVGRGDMVCWG